MRATILSIICAVLVFALACAFARILFPALGAFALLLPAGAFCFMLCEVVGDR
jgi:hypothetical protein